MFHVLEGVFDRLALEALQEAVAELAFEDGARTAGALARGVKHNAQATPSPARAAVLRRVEGALMAHPGFVSAARPKGFVRLIASRYAGGQTYGTHVDDALMAGQDGVWARTDLSFTLFLSDPASYDGGGLVVQDRLADRVVKLAAGGVILYPSDRLHRVQPVVDGVRLAVVGWVTSWVRDPAQREILFDLDAAIAAEQGADADRARLDRLARCRSNLLRMWAF